MTTWIGAGNTRDEWLRRRALKVPAPRYLHVSAPLVRIKGPLGWHTEVAPKQHRRTFMRQQGKQ